jgi:hypothetical protein
MVASSEGLAQLTRSMSWIKPATKHAHTPFRW